MQWYHYLSALGAGLFLANFIPHFVKGICGDDFPTPFAKPPGKGLSSPLVNVVWGLFNLVIAYLLLNAGKVTFHHTAALILFFAGVVLMSVLLAVQFSKKEKS